MVVLASIEPFERGWSSFWMTSAGFGPAGPCVTTALAPEVGPGADYESSRENLRRDWFAGAGVLPREAEVVSAVLVAECGEPRRLLAAGFAEVVAEAQQPR